MSEENKENTNENTPKDESQKKNRATSKSKIAIKVKTKKGCPWYVTILSMLFVVAICTFLFFGYFFDVSSKKNVIAMAIGAIILIVLIICVAVIYSKYIDKKYERKQESDINSTKALLDAYKEIFKK